MICFSPSLQPVLHQVRKLFTNYLPLFVTGSEAAETQDHLHSMLSKSTVTRLSYFQREKSHVFRLIWLQMKTSPKCPLCCAPQHAISSSLLPS